MGSARERKNDSTEQPSVSSSCCQRLARSSPSGSGARKNGCCYRGILIAGHGQQGDVVGIGGGHGHGAHLRHVGVPFTLAPFRSTILKPDLGREVRTNGTGTVVRYLHSCFGQITAQSELLADVHIGIVRFLKDALHFFQLIRRERRSIASLLALSIVIGVGHGATAVTHRWFLMRV